MKLTTEFIINSQKNGDIRKDIHIDFIMHQLNQLQQMVMDPVLIAKYEKPEEKELST